MWASAVMVAKTLHETSTEVVLGIVQQKVTPELAFMRMADTSLHLVTFASFSILGSKVWQTRKWNMATILGNETGSKVKAVIFQVIFKEIRNVFQKVIAFI